MPRGHQDTKSWLVAFLLEEKVVYRILKASVKHSIESFRGSHHGIFEWI